MRSTERSSLMASSASRGGGGTERSLSIIRTEAGDDSYDEPGENDSLLRSFPSKFSPTLQPYCFRDPQRADVVWRRYLSAQGITLSFREVTIVQKRFWGSQSARLLVQNCSGLFDAAKLHVIVDVEGRAAAGRALTEVLSGSATPAHGVVTGNNVPVSSARFRRAVGMVATEASAVLFSNLSVAENIAFSLQIRCRFLRPTSQELSADLPSYTGPKDCVPSFLRFGSAANYNRILAAASFFNLPLSTRARELSSVKKFLLVLAMEVVLDPPIIFVAVPQFFGGLDPHGVTEVLSYMKQLCTLLGKTVVCLMQSLPFPVFDRCDSVVLLGLEGQTLYSGEKSDMLSYFSTLGLPADTLSSPVYDAFAPARREGADRATVSLISSNSISIPNSNAFSGSNSFAIAAAAEAPHPRDSSTAEAAAKSRGRVSSAPTRILAQQSATMSRPKMCYDDDEEDTLVIDTGDAAVDLAILWSESLDVSVKYAAVYYDSGVRKQLTQRQEEHELANTWSGTLTSSAPNSITFLRFEPQSPTNQVVALCHIFFLQNVRQSDFYILWAVLALVLGFTSWLVSNQHDDQLGMMNTRGLIFLIFFVALQVNVGYVHTYLSEIELFRYQRDSGFYSTWVYLTVFFVRLVLSRIVYLATIVPFILYLLQTSRTLITLVGLLSVSHAAIVYCKALLFQDLRLTQSLVLLYVGFCVVFSGFLVNLTSLPSPIGYMSLLRNGYAAAVAQQFAGKPYSCDAGNSSDWTNHTTSYCYTGDQYLALEGFQFDSVDRANNIFVCVTLATMAIIALRMWWM